MGFYVTILFNLLYVASIFLVQNSIHKNHRYPESFNIKPLERFPGSAVKSVYITIFKMLFDDAIESSAEDNLSIIETLHTYLEFPTPSTIEYAQELPDTKTENSTGIFRPVSTLSGKVIVEKDGLIPHHPELLSPYQAIELAAKAFGSRLYVGEREVLGEKPTGGKILSDYKYYTYSDAFKHIQSLGRALDMEVGVPTHEFSNGDKLRIVGIWAHTSLEWRLLDLALNYRKMVSVPLYDSLGPESIEYIIKTTCMEVIAVTGPKVDSCLDLVKKGIGLKAVISFDKPTQQQIDAYAAAGVKLYHQKELRNRYLNIEDTTPASELVPSREDVATIIYTSGTTGNPKGAVHTNGSFLSISTGYFLGGNRMRITKEDVVLCFLPLAHIYQRAVEHMVSLIGASLGYFSGDLLGILDDLQALKPTVFIGVPRVYTKLLGRIKDGIQSKPALVRWLANKALVYKEDYYHKDSKVLSSFIPDMIFSKIRATFGGRLRSFSMGSAPMDSKELLDLQMYFSAPICEGWGMTETGIVFLQDAYDGSKGTIGGPLGTLEFKIVSVPDSMYNAHGEVPRGELLVRGPCLMREYFLDKERTAEAIDADGWLHTGDVVELMPNKAVKIIDRSKNIFKLAQGEYIAPERLENVYGAHEWVEQIVVYGNSLKSCLVAVIVPKKAKVEKWAQDNNKGNMKFEECLNLPELRKQILVDLEAYGRSHHLHGYEIIRGCRLISELLSIENGLLTPTMKLVRAKATKHFESLYNEAYTDTDM